MGRSRGGLTTKIHAVVDANGNPFHLKLTEGQAHDGRSADDMLGSVGKGQTLLADRAYDSDALRNTLAERGAKANIKPMPNRVNIPKFNKKLYRKRNLVSAVWLCEPWLISGRLPLEMLYAVLLIGCDLARYWLSGIEAQVGNGNMDGILVCRDFEAAHDAAFVAGVAGGRDASR